MSMLAQPVAAGFACGGGGRVARFDRFAQPFETDHRFVDPHVGQDRQELVGSEMADHVELPQTPAKRLARTVTTHLTGILNGFEAGKHNGRVEAMHRALQEARARARGYRRVENFIAMACLVAGKLTYLPAPPFAQMAVIPHRTE